MILFMHNADLLCASHFSLFLVFYRCHLVTVLGIMLQQLLEAFSI